MKDPIHTERRAAEALKAFLGAIPQFAVCQMTSIGNPGEADRGVDIIAETEFAGRPLKLVVEIKSNGQPRMAHQAAYQLKRYLEQSGQEGVPMFIAPYLSEQAQEVCREEDIAYLDFQGNARLAFDTIFIERKVEGKPDPGRRSLRTLFKPKSARILRVLLEEPQRPWRVTELAEAAKVSLGLVSTFGTALREHEWADQTEQGLVRRATGLPGSVAPGGDLPTLFFARWRRSRRPAGLGTGGIQGT